MQTMEKDLILIEEEIKSKIYSIRGEQVMLDRELAKLYQVETKVFNQAVKRNITRFPKRFRFQLTEKEFETIKKSLRSQNVTLENQRGKHSKYLPFAFTEQGISMLSAVLKSTIAIEVSIKIIDSFINMRKIISQNSNIFNRLNQIEKKHILFEAKTEEKFDKIFNLIELKNIKPKQGIFFEGQMFDAYEFVADLVRGANNNIKLIDNYVDDTVLTLFSKNQDIDVTIYTQKRGITKQLKLDLEKYNSQYREIKVKEFNKSHDRFMIIDNLEVYLIGASLKDLGKKWFGFSKMDIDSLGIVEKLD